MFKQPAKDGPPPPVDFKSEPSPAPEPQPPASPVVTPAPTPSPAPNAFGAGAQAPRPAAGTSAASVIAPDLLIKGGIEGRGEIQLQGKAWGDVKVERLMVGEAATLEGSVEAVMVEVRGRVTGSIAARQIKLLPSAKVEGDITYEQLSIDNGAHFEGRCIKSKGDSGNPDIKGLGGVDGAKPGNGAAA